MRAFARWLMASAVPGWTAPFLEGVRERLASGDEQEAIDALAGCECRGYLEDEIPDGVMTSVALKISRI
jgi:hypothetical protein